MTIEDRLHDFTRAIDAAMSPVRPLDLLPVPGAVRPAGRRAAGGHRWPARLVPLSAAAAVIAVAVTLIVIRDFPRVGMQPAGVAGTASGAAGSGPATGPEALPAYFVALGRRQDPVIVGETRTGRVLATVPSPAGAMFAGVTGAADDRTFVLDAMPKQADPTAVGKRTWYLLRVTPGTATPTRLVKLAIPSVPARDAIEGIALSPDGTKLAVLCQGGAPAAGPFTLRVYSVADGALVHGWTGTDPSNGFYSYGSAAPPDNNHTLSWAADGRRLAFAFRSSKATDYSVYLRMVDLTGPGEDLFADSTVILKIAVSAAGNSAIWCESLAVTGDGRAAVCGAMLQRVAPTGITLDTDTRPVSQADCAGPAELAYPGIAQVSLASRKLTKVLYQVKLACMVNGTSAVLWASPSGQAVLSWVSYTSGPSLRSHTEVVLADHGTVTRLTWPGADTLLYNGAF
jgi:hypothetical protein